MPYATQRTSVPVIVDADKCIADKGCTVCVGGLEIPVWSSCNRNEQVE